MAYPSHFADTGSKIDLFAGMVLEWIGKSSDNKWMVFGIYCC